jgi:ribosomal protein S30
MSKSTGKVVKTIRTIPIDEIRFLNPRVRNRRNFHEIVQSIAKVASRWLRWRCCLPACLAHSGRHRCPIHDSMTNQT